MVDRELISRQRLRRLVPDLEEEVDHTELDEEDYQCATCRVLCFLSQVTVEQGEDDVISCLDHYAALPEGPKRFRLRYADDELLAMYTTVKTRAGRSDRDRSQAAQEAAAADSRKRKASTVALEALSAEQELPNAQRAKMDDVPPPFVLSAAASSFVPSVLQTAQQSPMSAQLSSVRVE